MTKKQTLDFIDEYFKKNSLEKIAKEIKKIKQQEKSQ